MAKGFIDQLIETLTLDEPDKYFVKSAKQRLFEWHGVYRSMSADTTSDLWDIPFFIALHKEYKFIFNLLKERDLLPPALNPKLLKEKDRATRKLLLKELENEDD